MSQKALIGILFLAVIVKGLLFFYAQSRAPEMKYTLDSRVYLNTADTLAGQGRFGTLDENGVFSYEFTRTPGYPLFLALFHGILKIPLSGIIALQLFLTLLSAGLVTLAARRIDPRLGPVALIIMLFDPAISVHALMVLTESLYLFVLSVFLYLFINYVQTRKISMLLAVALMLSAATYVRPVSFYLSIPLGLVVLATHGRAGTKKGFVHAMIFVLTVHALLFAWQARNHRHLHLWTFSTIDNATVKLSGLYKSYERNEDPVSRGLPPPLYYANVSSRSLMSLMTRPVSLKYFGSDAWKKAGKLFSYPWIAFWLAGLLAGLVKGKKDIVYATLAVTLIYFIVVTVIATMWGTGARFRIPLMPFIAILSAQGWLKIKGGRPLFSN